MKVSDILRIKGNIIYSVIGEITVYDALKIMGDKNIGALLIIEQEKLVGIFSERDYARKVVLKGKMSKDVPVNEIMTEQVITVTEDDSIESCMALMSQKHFRHLPVVKEDKVTGMISIGDVVNAIIASQKETIAHLQHYISQ